MMKASQKKKYKYITDLHTDLETSYLMYVKEVQAVFDESLSNYYWLADRKQLSRFSTYAQKAGIYGNHNGYSTAIGKILFTSHGTFCTHSSMLTGRKLNALFLEFRKSKA